MIIYADELFIKNFIMTYLILIIVGEILEKKYKKINIILGSIVSSLITLFAVIYKVENNIIVRAISIVLMNLISFKTKEINIFIIEITFILITTFLLGGVIKSNINNFYEIILCGVISILAIKKYTDYYKKKKWKIRNKYKIQLEIENRKIELNALLDTGNFLTTNIKNEPVIIISKDVILNKVSKELFNLLTKGEIGNLNFNVLKNIRPINYSTIKEKNKTIYGLRIKNVLVKIENKEIIRPAVIALSEIKIKESDAIIGISLLEGGMESGDTINIKAESKEIVC